MEKKDAGKIVLVAVAALNVLLWIIFGPHNDGSRPNFNRQLIAEIIASTTVVCLRARHSSRSPSLSRAVFWRSRPDVPVPQESGHAGDLFVDLPFLRCAFECQPIEARYATWNDCLLGAPGIRVLSEAHPFTISSAPHEDDLRLSIKA